MSRYHWLLFFAAIFTVTGHVRATTSTSAPSLKNLDAGKVVLLGDNVSGISFVKIGDNQYMSVEPGCTDPALTTTGAVKNFSYTGGQQTHKVYAGCEYKLEVWGGQGGGGMQDKSISNNGGYGGYAVGTYFANTDQTLYLYVGGMGANGVYRSDSAGGYNGGGNGNWDHSDDDSGAGGGGATHIAKSAGLLNTMSGKVTDILIVAGGGGGGGQRYSDSNPGGHAGGYIGNNLMYLNGGGRNISLANSGGTQTGGYKFGQGEYITYVGANSTSGGGGGGYYGGKGTPSNAQWYGAGAGGSGYIASANLISSNGVTKHMTCYSCTTSTAASTYTISNTCVDSTAKADCAKTGNGYARITRLN